MCVSNSTHLTILFRVRYLMTCSEVGNVGASDLLLIETQNTPKTPKIKPQL